MASSKRGGGQRAGWQSKSVRGEAKFGRGGFKKASAKRAGFDDEDSRPSKKSKADNEEDSTPFVPELKTNGDDERYVGVGTHGLR